MTSVGRDIIIRTFVEKLLYNRGHQHLSEGQNFSAQKLQSRAGLDGTTGHIGLVGHRLMITA